MEAVTHVHLSTPTEATTLSREQQCLRVGALCLVVGSLCVLVVRVAHGDLPTDTGEQALSFVAASRLYPFIHLGDWLGVLVWTGGLIALAESLTNRRAWAIGRLGAVSVLVGAAVHITEFSIDGYALPTLASTWATTAPADRASLEYGARLVLVAIGGPSTSALAILWGTTLISFGIAIRSEGFDSAFGWTGAIVGAAILALGVIQFVKSNVVFPGVIVYGGGTIVSQLWTLVLGFLMWRRAHTSPTQAAALPEPGIHEVIHGESRNAQSHQFDIHHA
jgi:hypothetical protein